MKIPNHLKHKAVIVAEDYDCIDGPYAGKTDAQGLSLGLAQWNDRGNVDISAKVWRHTGWGGEEGKWSRQSEELPLHRVLDLALLICKAHKHLQQASRREKLYDPEQPTIGEVEFVNEKTKKTQSMKVDINIANESIDGDIKLFGECFRCLEENEIISMRLRCLAEELKDMDLGCEA